MLTQILNTMKQYALENHVPIIKDDAGKLLVQIVKDTKPQHILEIGTAIGYSTLLMAQQMPKDALITTIEIDSQRIEVAKKFIAHTPYVNQIRLIHGDAADIIPSLDKKIDFVFMDAAKGQYVKYLNLLMDKFADKAVIIADNVLFKGYIMSEGDTPRRYRTIVKRLREYIKIVTRNNYFTTQIYEFDDGISVTYYQGENKIES